LPFVKVYLVKLIFLTFFVWNFIEEILLIIFAFFYLINVKNMLFVEDI
jgi:hypothetical protein